jgi:hypothetical protein
MIMIVQNAVHDGLSKRTWEAVPMLNNHTPCRQDELQNNFLP